MPEEDWKSKYEDLAKRNTQIREELELVRAEKREYLEQSSRLTTRLDEEKDRSKQLLTAVSNLSEAMKNQKS